MLTAAASLALFVATTAAASAPAAPLQSTPMMPLVIGVTAASDISRAVVAAIVRESDAIWRAAGFRFVWIVDPHVATANLRVFIGGGTSPATDRQTPLAWISLDAAGVPEPSIYLSHANAQRFLRASRGSVGPVEAMPTLQRNTYVGRALGRALAHEVGHYLMGSKAHAARGLMRGTHTSVEFFSTEARTFTIDAFERQRMAARFTSIYMASRG
jgi:hypothetical protein